MAVELRKSTDVLRAPPHDQWCAIDAHNDQLPGTHDRLVDDLAQKLDQWWDATKKTWVDLAKALSGDGTATLAHAPSCVWNSSDLGQMIAWSYLVESWIGKDDRVLVVCDDPWMFRHLAGLTEIGAGSPPPLWPRALKLWLRGYAARGRATFAMFLAAIGLHGHRRKFPKHANTLLVYGHPTSDCEGFDGYFGDLMGRLAGLARVLHVDCPPARARELATDGRSTSLHAWGNPLSALGLPFVKWKPSEKNKSGKYGWLVRRAAAMEGGGGQAAMIRWQQICQENWLRQTSPRTVAWPWENQSWERDFVRAAKRAKSATVGYQHSNIGKQTLNYACDSNPDGFDSIPDILLTSGKTGRRRLLDFGYGEERIRIGGALRTKIFSALTYDPKGPILLALPFSTSISLEMIEAAKFDLPGRRQYLVKDHPMTPCDFSETGNLKRTDKMLSQQVPLSAVVYAATTVGLEALIGGLPAFQFLPRGRVANDVLPDGVNPPMISAKSWGESLDGAEPPPKLDPEVIFSKPDYALWHSLLDDPE